MSLAKLLRIAITLLEIPVSEWTCLRTDNMLIRTIRQTDHIPKSIPMAIWHVFVISLSCHPKRDCWWCFLGSFLNHVHLPSLCHPLSHGLTFVPCWCGCDLRFKLMVVCCRHCDCSWVMALVVLVVVVVILSWISLLNLVEIYLLVTWSECDCTSHVTANSSTHSI